MFQIFHIKFEFFYNNSILLSLKSNNIIIIKVKLKSNNIMEFSKKQLQNFKNALINLWESDKDWYKVNSVQTENSDYMGDIYHEHKILKTLICTPKENVIIERLCPRAHGSKTFRKNHLYFITIEHILVKSVSKNDIYVNRNEIIYHTLSQFPEKSGLYPKWEVQLGYNIIKKNDIKLDTFKAFNKYFDIIEEIII